MSGGLRRQFEEFHVCGAWLEGDWDLSFQGFRPLTFISMASARLLQHEALGCQMQRVVGL